MHTDRHTIAITKTQAQHTPCPLHRHSHTPHPSHRYRHSTHPRHTQVSLVQTHTRPITPLRRISYSYIKHTPYNHIYHTYTTYNHTHYTNTITFMETLSICVCVCVYIFAKYIIYIYKLTNTYIQINLCGHILLTHHTTQTHFLSHNLYQYTNLPAPSSTAPSNSLMGT